MFYRCTCCAKDRRCKSSHATSPLRPLQNMKLGFFHVAVVEKRQITVYKKVWYTCKVVVLLFKLIALMTFSLSSLSSDLKVPIAFVTCCYHTPSSIKERAHSHLSYSISSVKDVIVFPCFIFSLLWTGKNGLEYSTCGRVFKNGRNLWLGVERG